jgi:hypothetical protein
MAMSGQELTSLRRLAGDLRTENPRLARAIMRGHRRHSAAEVRCAIGWVALLVSAALALAGGPLRLALAAAGDVLGTLLLHQYLRA